MLTWIQESVVQHVHGTHQLTSHLSKSQQEDVSYSVRQTRGHLVTTLLNLVSMFVQTPFSEQPQTTIASIHVRMVFMERQSQIFVCHHVLQIHRQFCTFMVLIRHV